MRANWLISISLLSLGPLCAQNSAPEQPPEIIGRATVTDIIVPVTVHDRDGNMINGLQPRNFHLYDNDKEQNIAVDVSFHPISLVIAVQANASVEAILPQVKKIGSMLESLVAGDQGEAAVLAFDHRFQVKQEFTSDLAKISEALKKVTPGASSSRLIDAMDYGVRMLRTRPNNRRRVLLVISETRDLGSSGKLREAVLDAQLSNVSVYTVNMSRMVATLTDKPQPRPENRPPSMHPMPSNVPATPTTVMQKGVTDGSSANFVPCWSSFSRTPKRSSSTTRLKR